MASEWPTRKFGEICEHSAFGPRFSSDEYDSSGNVACLRTTDIGADGTIDFPSMPLATLDLSRLRTHILRRGDLVITRTGAYLGKAAVFTEFWLPVLPGAFSIRFRLNTSIADPYYCRYYINSTEGQTVIRALATGSAQPNLNIPNLHSMEIPLPPLEVQRRIVFLLSGFDDKIEQNRRTGRALERLARAVFKAWFVDFEPVKAKAAGATSLPGMPRDAFATLPARLVDSDLGPVPEGWNVVPLSHACSIVSGGTPKRSTAEYWGGSIPWYSVKDAPGDGMPWVLFTDERITQAGVDNSAAAIVPRGCTIISARGTVGKLAMVACPMTFNQSCYGLLPSDGKSFAYLNLLLRNAVSELQHRTHGSVFDTITRTTFDGLSVVGPKPETVLAFEKNVEPLFDLLLALLKESAKLAELRDYLLPRLLSGRVRVREATREVEAV